MLKPVQKNIELTVYVADTTKSLKYILSIHTTLREIAIKIANDMNIDVFRSNISFRTRYNYVKLDIASTLNQNKLTNDKNELYANIDSISTKERLSIRISQKTSLANNNNLSKLDLIDKFPLYMTKIPTLGLGIEGICQNKKCIYHERKIFCSLGVGTFNLKEVLTKIKCPTCPYKDLNVHPPIIINKMIFKGCVWRILKNYMIDERKMGVDVDKWFPAREEQESEFFNYIGDVDEKLINIEVRGIHAFKQSNYQKYSFQGNTFNFKDDFVHFHY